MSRVRAAQRLLGFVGIRWSPEAKPPQPPRRGLAWCLPRVTLPPIILKVLAFVGVWLEAPDGNRIRRSL